MLFHAWASALEQAGDTRKADAVYVKGIESQAEPVDWLKSQHRSAMLSLYWHFLSCSYDMFCFWAHVNKVIQQSRTTLLLDKGTSLTV